MDIYENAFNLKRPNAPNKILVFVLIRNFRLKLINFMMKSKHYFNNPIDGLLKLYFIYKSGKTNNN